MKPSTTDWLQAWGTIAGAIFAAAAAVAAFLVLVHEIKVRRQDENDLRASTARSVLVTTGDELKGIAPTKDADGTITSMDFRINNFSRFPVIDVLVAVQRLSGEKVLSWATDLIKPGETSVLKCVLDPALTYSHWDYPPDLFHTTIEFTDDNGLRWQRTDRKQPNRIFASNRMSVHDFPGKRGDR